MNKDYPLVNRDFLVIFELEKNCNENICFNTSEPFVRLAL